MAAPLAPLLTELLLAAGPADRALAVLLAVAAARRRRARWPPAWPRPLPRIRARAPTLRLTVDPVEFRGFRYETGVCMTVFAAGEHEELGRGGRYLCGDAEPATGLTLYPDAILRARPAAPKLRPRLYLPFGTAGRRCRRRTGPGFRHHRRPGPAPGPARRSAPPGLHPCLLGRPDRPARLRN